MARFRRKKPSKNSPFALCPSRFIPRLDWKAPTDGGAVTVYRLQRCQRPEGEWQGIGLSMETKTTLTAQERSKDLEYRVIAVNKAGEGEPSNTVMAVL